MPERKKKVQIVGYCIVLKTDISIKCKRHVMLKLTFFFFERRLNWLKQANSKIKATGDTSLLVTSMPITGFLESTRNCSYEYINELTPASLSLNWIALVLLEEELGSPVRESAITMINLHINSLFKILEE